MASGDVLLLQNYVWSTTDNEMCLKRGGWLGILKPRWKTLILLRPSCVPSPTNFRSFPHAVFTNIDSETIEKSYFVGKDGRLLERAWQMEFYRAAIQALPSNIYISADVGAY